LSAASWYECGFTVSPIVALLVRGRFVEEALELLGASERRHESVAAGLTDLRVDRT
jgi:hypothetical protein